MISKTLLVVMLFVTTLSSVAQRADSLVAQLDSVRNERRVKTLNLLSGEYVDSDPVKAFGYAREALNLATEIGDRRGLAAAYNNLGVLYKAQGALDKSLEYYMKSLHIYDTLQLKDSTVMKLGVASIKNNMANIYSLKKDHNLATKYLEESHKLFVELKDDRHIIGSLNNLGILYSDIDMDDRAMQYFIEATSLGEKIGLKNSDSYNNVGNIFFSQGNFQRAVEFYEKALQIARDKNDRVGILKTAINLGVTYAKARQPAAAKVYLDEALVLCNDLQAYADLPAIYKAMASNEAIQNNFKGAYEMQLRYDDARQKIYSEESSRNIAQMEMIIEFEEKEHELSSLRAQSEIDRLELRSRTLFIVVITISGLAIVGGYNFYYINKKQSLKARKELAKALSRDK
ncbi:tetratricopeptide repeat protein [Chryseolinea sp. T2]|uniref:tetratricopeptide repeat protein n=1 Tax=Chryseolinea sp. T2 TaxID=3129255 RepID=UPI0030785308